MSLITLYRGCRSFQEAENIKNNKTARGYNPANQDATPPTDEKAIQYVGNGEGLDDPMREEKNSDIPEFVEYTTDINIAIQFGRHRGGVVMIKIDKKYCTKGSGCENSFVIHKNAPITFLWHKAPENIENTSSETPDSPLIPQ